jgi:hypothetical protein
MTEELKIGKLLFSKQYRTYGGLEIEAECPDYSGWSGPRTQDVYFFLDREEVVKLRDYLNRLLENKVE